MKIWIDKTETSSHTLVKLNCEKHSNFKFLGDLEDDAIVTFFKEIQEDIDVEKNLKLLKYYGYLHLFVIHKSS